MEQSPDADISECAAKLSGNTFDILMNGANQFLIHFKFHANGTMSSNQTMFEGAPWRAVNKN